ncbi:hypothetical protein D3C84_851960 [compost metagenome]
MQTVQFVRGHRSDFGNRIQVAAQITQALIRAPQRISPFAPFVDVLINMPPATLQVPLDGRPECVTSHRVIDDPCRVRRVAGHSIGCSIHDDRSVSGVPVDPLRIRLYICWQRRGVFIGFEVRLP